MTPKKGDQFTHKHFKVLDPETIFDERVVPRSIPALMKITAVRKGVVYYTYASSRYNRGAWKMSVEKWIEVYGNDD